MTAITTVEQLRELPAGTVLRDHEGQVWLRLDLDGLVEQGEWRGLRGHAFAHRMLIHYCAPLTVLHRPDLPDQDVQAARIQAALDLHQRVDIPAHNGLHTLDGEEIAPPEPARTDCSCGWPRWPCPTRRALEPATNPQEHT